jgi:hypothetical protein
MQVCLFRKKEEAALLLTEQRNNGTTIQDILLPRQKILSNRGKMPNGERSSTKEEKRRFESTVLSPLIKGLLKIIRKEKWKKMVREE